MENGTAVPILMPKVQVPPSRLQLVQRRRLLQALDEGLHRRLTLISAPAGYGKSTLLIQWAAASAWPLGWVTLEAGDNDIERFLTYLVSAVQAAGAEPAGLEEVMGVRFSLQPLPPETLLAILVNQLPTTVERLVIVLDDYHHIHNPDIHNFISALLDHLPHNIHLMIATRTDPPLQLARLRARDQLNEITERDLRFTPQEAGNFLEDVMGLRLSHDQIAELEARTEGWATGLQLAGLSLKDREHPAELIEALSGTHRYILDYLMEEVFLDLPALLQTFLLRTSILERLSPGLCDAVVGNLYAGKESSQSRQILEFMDASNLFIMPMDSQRKWYRFHPLFADFLRDRLASRHESEMLDLHRRAAVWYASHGLPAQAVEHFFSGGEMEHAADLVQEQSRELLTRGEITTMMRWIGALPEETLRRRPKLGLARAWGTLMRDPVRFRETIDRQIEQIAEGFQIASEELLSVLEEIQTDSSRRAELGEFAMLQAYAGRDNRGVDETILLFKAALDSLPESEMLLRGFTRAGLASTYARVGAIKAAEKAFAQAAQDSLASKSIYGYVACTDWQATMQAEQGLLTRAAENFHRAIETLSGQGQRPLPLSGHVYVGLADVMLEQNHLVEALEKVQVGLQVGLQVKDMDALLKGYAIQARILQALGRSEAALESVRKAEEYALTTQNPGCIKEAQAWKARLDLGEGDVQSVQRWAERRNLESEGGTLTEQPPDELEQLAYARLMMATGKSADALPILDKLISRQEQIGRNRALIESLALQALCLRSLGRSEEALRSLGRALLIAEPEGFARVFIQEGPAMAALLRSTGVQGHSPDYVKRLLEGFSEGPGLQEGIIEPLSERELEVLGLIAAGLTNAEIAADLVIAQSTVKTHINRIYAKLSAGSRTQAVARARQLQIIP